MEVKPYNIRTTVISPGAVPSELPRKASPSLTSPPASADCYREGAISADTFARMVVFAMSQPDDVDVNEILFPANKPGAVKSSLVWKILCPRRSPPDGEDAMKEVIVVIGAGSIGQAIARRVSAGKHVVLADLRQRKRRCRGEGAA